MNYEEYNNIRNSLNGFIKDKENEVEILEAEIKNLKKTIKLLNYEFESSMSETEEYIG